MLSANDIKIDIINLVSQIDDIEALKSIHDNVETAGKSGASKAEARPDFRNATTTVNKSKSYQEILAEQNYKPVSYDDFRALAEKIEWDHSLEELLEALD